MHHNFNFVEKNIASDMTERLGVVWNLVLVANEKKMDWEEWGSFEKSTIENRRKKILRHLMRNEEHTGSEHLFVA